MSLAEDYHAAHKARLERMGAPSPFQTPIPVKPARVIKPQAYNAGWDGMWFFDLVTNHSKEPRVIRVREIQDAVCRHYGVSILDMLSGRRTLDVTAPRQVAMYLCRTMTPHSHAEIGRRFGGRDHTTVIHAFQKIKGLLGFNLELTCDVNTLKKLLA